MHAKYNVSQVIEPDPSQMKSLPRTNEAAKEVACRVGVLLGNEYIHPIAVSVAILVRAN